MAGSCCSRCPPRACTCGCSSSNTTAAMARSSPVRVPTMRSAPAWESSRCFPTVTLRKTHFIHHGTLQLPGSSRVRRCLHADRAGVSLALCTHWDDALPAAAIRCHRATPCVPASDRSIPFYQFIVKHRFAFDFCRVLLEKKRPAQRLDAGWLGLLLLLVHGGHRLPIWSRLGGTGAAHLLMISDRLRFGVWLFYVQHTQAASLPTGRAQDGWSAEPAAILGSSTTIRREWCPGSPAISAIHHIHHLASREPQLHRLREAYASRINAAGKAAADHLDQPQGVPHLKLWDEDLKQMVRFPQRARDWPSASRATRSPQARHRV